MNRQRVTLLLVFVLCCWGVSQLLRIKARSDTAQQDVQHFINVEKTIVLLLNIGHQSAKLEETINQDRRYPHSPEPLIDADFVAIIERNQQPILEFPFNVQGLIPPDIKLEEGQTEIIHNDLVISSQLPYALELPGLPRPFTVIIKNSKAEQIGRFIIP